MKFKAIIFILLLISVVCVLALASHTSSKNHQIDDLEFALSSEDPDVRLGAVIELVDYGDKAVPVLAKALGDKDPKIWQAAAKALEKIGGQAADALGATLTNHDRNLRSRCVFALGLVGRPGLPYLFKAVESDPFPRTRMFAASGIARLAGPGDAPEIMKRIENQPIATQMHLIIALAEIRDKEAYEALDLLVRSPDPQVRFYVANAIADAPAKEAYPVLAIALKDEAAEVRMWAMYGLEKINVPESFPIVMAALEDENAYVRKEAAYALGNLGNPAAVPRLLGCLKDPNHLVRCDTAESLGKLADPTTIPSLKPLLADNSEAVQLRTAEAMALMKDYSGMDKLITFTGSPKPLYRYHARAALVKISGQDHGYDRNAWSRWWEQNRDSIEAKRSFLGNG